MVMCTSEAPLLETGDRIKEFVRQAACSKVLQQDSVSFRTLRTGEKQLRLPGETARVAGSIGALAEGHNLLHNSCNALR